MTPPEPIPLVPADTGVRTLPEFVPLDVTAPPDAIPSGGESQSTGGLGIQILRVFVENKLAVIGVVVVIFFVLFCFVGPLLYHTNQTDSEAALNNLTQFGFPRRPGKLWFIPFGGSPYPLGTDSSGFDLLGRLMYGGQASLIIGFASALVATLLGVVWGAISGFIGGWLDAFMMRIVDIALSIPILFLLIAMVKIWRETEMLLILVIAGVSWLIPARLIRGETLSLRVREYVQAVRVMGGRSGRIVGRHIVPNSVGTIVVFATFQVADSILLLAALGFIGLGIQPPGTDWGSMLADGVTYAFSGYWWQIYPAGLCIVLVVIAFNFVGDALRDALEVRLQRR